MSEKGKRRFEPLWTAVLGNCHAAGYDFQLYKKSNPPPIDADPVVLNHPALKDCKGL